MRANFLVFTVLAFAIGCNPQLQPGQQTEHGRQIEPEAQDAFSLDPWMSRVGGQSMVEIASLENDRELIDLSGTDIADDDLANLRHFDQIKSLDLSSTNLTDRAAKHILNLHSVRELDVVFTHITGVGIRELGAHPDVTTIQVWHDQLDEDGLAGLQDMENLKKVYLWVPDFGNEDEVLLPKIKRARPDVDVEVMWYVDPMNGL